MTKLKARREKFCQEYIKDSDGTQAAIRAGYKPKSAQVTASRLLSKAMIKARLEELTEPARRKYEIDTEWVVARSIEIVQRCTQAEPVLDKDGNKTGEYKFDSRGANSALDRLSKFTGGFVDRHDHTTKDSKFMSMSDEQLKEIIIKTVPKLIHESK
jgi:phage terminase small subunit